MVLRFPHPARRFIRNEDGAYSIEAALVLPTLIWCSLAMLTYVDGYRQQTMNLRTTYALSDMLSRQWDPVGPKFVDGLGRVHDHLTESDDETFLRVTVAYWDEPANEHKLVWSDATSDGPVPLNQETLTDVAGAIPTMANGDSAIIVETWMNYVPAFNVGLKPSQFYNRVVTSPRFTPQLKYDVTK
ncbi:TadE/TadG family type IV pilus assembly protein [Palleronia pelagia]|uniref:Flp pilus assembly protein TadG n=1 Tax=Palleronia pelagia TaxID=387096 RepID=A0A1H8LSB9_9RHOB|nr:hypothetical protein [Palleronia pelagia]SEO08001.1 hypothetical protein SAMN04488011_11171 [Palleronia pelagia]